MIEKSKYGSGLFWLGAWAGVLVSATLSGAAVQELVEIGPRLSEGQVERGRTADLGPIRHGGQWSWHLKPSGDGSDTRVALTGRDGAWDLSRFDSVGVRITNPGTAPLVVWGQAANAGGQDNRDRVRNAVSVSPGGTEILRIRLVRRPEDPGWEAFSPFIMYFRDLNVRDNTVDPARIDRVEIWLEHPGQDQSLLIHQVFAGGEGEPAPVPFFPFVDEYGQYIHSLWPGKVYTDADFAARIEEEAHEMSDWPGAADWNEYGGWADGPQLEATGYFRVVKHDGKWWFVDPAGRLFFSYGPTGVGYGGGMTPVSEREHWFRGLPDRESEWGRFYGNGQGARYRYYQTRNWEGFGFAEANLYRKYGPDYEDIVADLSHDRLRSWGFNTIAAWSSEKVIAKQRTPYTAMIHYGGPKMYYRLPDVFHSDWPRYIRERLEEERHTTAKDPWNIGFFVDNELGWLWRPRAAYVGEVAMQRGRSTGSKLHFVKMLREKYETIGRFNTAWSRDHASWDDLIDSTEKPDLSRAEILADCGDFGMAFAKRYFSHIRAVLDDVAPNHLYLGPRFHGHIDPELVQLASEYVDVISYNIYDNPPDGRANQYRPIDRPIVIGEFSAGNNLVQTPFRYQGRPSPDPAHRLELLERYLRSAFRHPLIVGAHFFQYRDQPLSGRPDGEAGTRGFINATDTPHFDIIQTNRRLGYDLYRLRSGR
jgi:hypothetical protein